jgi:hypothetical protein
MASSRLGGLLPTGMDLAQASVRYSFSLSVLTPNEPSASNTGETIWGRWERFGSVSGGDLLSGSNRTPGSGMGSSERGHCILK